MPNNPEEVMPINSESDRVEHLLSIADKSGTGKTLGLLTEIPPMRIEAMSWYWRFLTPVEFQRVGVVKKGPSPRC
jgi:hypothetical protein